MSLSEIWLCGSIVFLSTKMLPMPIFRFLQIGILGWWQWCLIDLLSFASSGMYLTIDVVLLPLRRVLVSVLLQYGPTL